MFLKLYKKDYIILKKNYLKKNILFLRKKQLKFFLSILKKENLFLNVFMKKLYLKGYNYRVKFLRKTKILRLNLGFPIPLFIKIPNIIKIKRTRKKVYCFYSFD